MNINNPMGYISEVTDRLTPDDWQEVLNPKALSLDEAVDILADCKSMEAFGKKLTGYMKQVVRSKMPDDEEEPEYIGTHFSVHVNKRTRKGGLNEPLIIEEMGEDWVEEHRKPPTEYEEIRVKANPGTE